MWYNIPKCPFLTITAPKFRELQLHRLLRKNFGCRDYVHGFALAVLMGFSRWLSFDASQVLICVRIEAIILA